MINGLESMNLKGRKKYYSNIKKSTLIRMLKHPDRTQKAREKQQLYGKSVL